MSASDRKWNRTKLYAALLGSALAFGACSPAESDDPVLNPGYTQDTGTAVVPEASVPGNDAGATLPLPAQDSGTGVLPGNDSSVQQPLDSSLPAVDSSVPGADTSTTPDATSGGDDGSVIPGNDGSTGGDTSVPDSSTPDAQVPRADQGKGDGKDVVLIGDSWMNNTLGIIGTGGGISPALIRASRQPYRDYAEQGVELLANNAFGSAIPTQWDSAVRANKNIKTVVMTAGGNDVIQSTSVQESCKNGTAECKAMLEKIGKALAQLWGKMAAAGVTDIVHIMYAKVAGDGVKEGEANAASLKQLCDNVPAPARCHLFFTDAYVKTKSDLVIDGIHPSAASNTNMAKALVEFMAKEGMRR